MPGFSVRLAISSVLGLLFALLSVPARLSGESQHSICTLHPSILHYCLRLSKGLPGSISGLTYALTSLPSSTSSERFALEYTSVWLSRHGFVVARQPLSSASHDGSRRENLLALLGNATPQSLRVLLCTHLDVVPGQGRPLGVPSYDSDRVRGRGTVDARGQAAGMMLALNRLRDSRVGLLLVMGEETDHAGMLEAANLGFDENIVIVNGEPTESRLATSQKGMAKIVIKVTGKAAHSGYPELGDSAVDKLLSLLADLKSTGWPKRDGESTTMNVGVLKGGIASNVVAPQAEAGIMFRLVGNPEEVLQRVQATANRYGNVTVDLLTHNPPIQFLAPKRIAADLGTTTVAYNTDVPYYRGKYRAAVLFGAGSIRVAHTDDESVDIEELEQLPTRLISIVKELLMS